MIVWFRVHASSTPVKLPAVKQAVFLNQAGYLVAAVAYPGQGIWLESRLTGDVAGIVKQLGLDLMQTTTEGAEDPAKLVLQLHFEDGTNPTRQSDVTNAWITDDYGQLLLLADVKFGKVRMVQLNTSTSVEPLAAALVPGFQRAPLVRKSGC